MTRLDYPSTAAWGLLVAVLTGCGPDTTSVGGGGSGEEAADSNETGTDGCVPIPGCADASADYCGCSAPPVCDAPGGGLDGAYIEGPCYNDPPELSGPWECVLQALAADQPATLSISMLDNMFGGDGGCLYDEVIVLLGDGTALFTRFAGDGYPMRRVQLQPPSFFENCLAQSAAEDTVPCLTNWFTEDVCEEVECCLDAAFDVGPPVCGE